jgi:hypothetical protein
MTAQLESTGPRCRPDCPGITHLLCRRRVRSTRDHLQGNCPWGSLMLSQSVFRRRLFAGF